MHRENNRKFMHVPLAFESCRCSQTLFNVTQRSPFKLYKARDNNKQTITQAYNITTNMGKNNTTGLVVQIHHIIQYAKGINMMRSRLVKIHCLQFEFWSNCILG